MEDDLTPEKEFIRQEKERRYNELEILQMIGKFSQKNMRFINDLKREGIFSGNDKRNKKNFVYAKNGTQACTVIFDYDKLDVKTEGDSDFCNKLRRRI